MKKALQCGVTRALAVSSFVAIAALASAQASVPLYEPFSYSNGNLTGNSIAGGTWTQTGNNTVNPVQVSAGSLSYAGLPASQGGKVTLLNGTGFEDTGLDIAGQNSGSVYASFILNVVNPGNTAGDYFFHFSSAGTNSTDYRTRVRVRQGSGGPTTFNIGLNHGNSDPIWWSGDLPVGTPVFVVAAYNFVDSGDDTSSIWINPALGQPTSPAADGTATATLDLTTLGRIGLRQGSGNTSLNVELDELRISTSWTDVTPTNAAVGDWSVY